MQKSDMQGIAKSGTHRTRQEIGDSKGANDRIPIAGFPHRDGEVVFREPLAARMLREEGKDYVVNSEELDIHATGKTVDEAVHDFRRYLSSFWEVYVECLEEEPGDGARQPREKLEGMVE